MDEVMLKKQELAEKFDTAYGLIDDVVLKNYLSKLEDMEIVPLDDEFMAYNQSNNIRLFKINEMVYEKDEFFTYKFASVLNSLSNIDCGVFLLIQGNGVGTDFYMGIRSDDETRTTSSVKLTLENALKGQFPGVKTQNLNDDDIKAVIGSIEASSLSAVSCVANVKNQEMNDNDTFVQGMEKFATAMQGEKYTAIILANSTDRNQLNRMRREYEDIYTAISPYANCQMSYGQTMSFSTGLTETSGKSSSVSNSSSNTVGTSQSYTKGESENTSKSVNTSKSITKPNINKIAGKGIETVLAAVGGYVGFHVAGVGTAIGAAGGAMVGNIVSTAMATVMGDSKTESTSDTSSTSTGRTYSEARSESQQSTTGHSQTEGTSYSKSKSDTESTGTVNSTQLTLQNKSVISMMNRIDKQLTRIDECESVGMWECAAYFMSDNQYCAEIAATTYKALMNGENTGVEVSAINTWDARNKDKLAQLKDYMVNFIHPVFNYSNLKGDILLTPCTLVSGNELAIHMGLPKKSVCGFPVIEHADFGKEVVRYNADKVGGGISLGNIFNMGCEGKNKVVLSRESLSMHTFVTGSTGSGKSNTVYKILEQLDYSDIPFMVIEPAKGEYKNVFGNLSNVKVLGTNPQYSELLCINPFKFPKQIHILEHIDRLIEVLNVCWPMYAAMPAVLKEAVLKAYEDCGWNLSESKNCYSEDIFPTFLDLLAELDDVIENSAYSEEVKSNYKGSLITRVKSMTNGLNGMMFGTNETDNTVLFDRSVIIDLSRVGSSETKSLVMGVLVMRLNEHRMSNATGMNSRLKHITVLEEAHNILKRTSTEQNSEGANVLGKSVEMISNSIAEMRTYGEGFIIADQAPNAVDISAIRNTNTKIIMRLPEESDRQMAGRSAGLKDVQISEIAKLPKGVAVVYQNDWVEPVLCKISKYNGSETQYKYTPNQNGDALSNTKAFNTKIVQFLLKGRVDSNLDLNIDNIISYISQANISTYNKIKLLGLANEYKNTGKLEMWNNEKFTDLSDVITDVLDMKGFADKLIKIESSFEHLTYMLKNGVEERTIDLSQAYLLSVCQCLLRKSAEADDAKMEIYKAWYTMVKEARIV